MIVKILMKIVKFIIKCNSLIKIMDLNNPKVKVIEKYNIILQIFKILK